MCLIQTGASPPRLPRNGVSLADHAARLKGPSRAGPSHVVPGLATLTGLGHTRKSRSGSLSRLAQKVAPKPTRPDTRDKWWQLEPSTHVTWTVTGSTPPSSGSDLSNFSKWPNRRPMRGLTTNFPPSCAGGRNSVPPLLAFQHHRIFNPWVEVGEYGARYHNSVGTAPERAGWEAEFRH